MNSKYLMFDLEDEKSRKLGEVISNPTCKKIINLLAEKELSATEVSRELKIPMNTLDYNLKKLIEAGIIEKSKHFWSVKGKKIPTYKVVNKVIVIQPKKTSNSSVYSKLKNITPLVVVSAFLTALVALITRQEYVSYSNLTVDEGLKAAGGAAQETLCINGPSGTLCGASQNFLLLIQPWMWFAFGALIIIIALLIINWKKL